MITYVSNMSMSRRRMLEKGPSNSGSTVWDECKTLKTTRRLFRHVSESGKQRGRSTYVIVCGPLWGELMCL